MSFTYRTESFEGPMELLLSLIESEKMPITELSLAHVAQEFLSYVGGMEKFDEDLVSRFLSVASTLLLLKARALLPIPDLSEEEETDIVQLEYRLRIYNTIVQGAAALRELWDQGAPLYVRDSSWQLHPTFIPDSTLTGDTLCAIATSIIAKQSIDTETPVPELTKLRVRSIMKLEDVMERLHALVTPGNRFSLRSTIASRNHPEQTKVDTIVSFLAVLELARNGLVALSQAEHGDDIWVQAAQAAADIRP